MAARFLQAVKVAQAFSRALREMKPRATRSLSRNDLSGNELSSAEAALEFSDSSDAGVPKLDPDVFRQWEHKGEIYTSLRERRRFSLRVIAFAYLVIATTSLAQYWAVQYRRKRIERLTKAELPPEGEMV